VPPGTSTGEPTVATVSRLQVTAVKGFQLRAVPQVRFGPQGIAGDRAFAVVDDSDAVLTVGRTSAYLPLWSELDVEEDVLTIGRDEHPVLSQEVRTGESIRVHFFGERYGIGQVVSGGWSELLSDLAGERVRLVRTSGPLGGYDVHPVTVVSEASVAALGEDADGGPMDGRRFRMTMTLAGLAAFGEDALKEHRVAVGSAGCALLMGGPVKRCAAVQRHPTGVPVRLNALRRINEVRGVAPSELGRGLNLGVYAAVASPGQVRLGDAVRLGG
jgi:uncharacterized protein YcbX